MSSRKRRSPTRFRVGRVSVYLHHGNWWLYFRDGGKPVRRRIAADRSEAERVAAQVNAQLLASTPTLLSFSPVSVPALRQRFLDYHENVMKSSVGTVRRYRAATQHFENFAHSFPTPIQAHQIRPDAFAAYLRTTDVAPNGHPNAKRRRLRDRGVQYVLQTVRAMYTLAGKWRNLPPHAGNPFSELPLDRMKLEDAKPIFLFDADTELSFLQAADEWEFTSRARPTCKFVYVNCPSMDHDVSQRKMMLPKYTRTAMRIIQPTE